MRKKGLVIRTPSVGRRGNLEARVQTTALHSRPWAGIRCLLGPFPWHRGEGAGSRSHGELKEGLVPARAEVGGY